MFRREYYVVETRSLTNPGGAARVSNWHEPHALRKLFQRTGMRFRRTYEGSMQLTDRVNGEILLTQGFQTFTDVSAAKIVFRRANLTPLLG